MFTKIWERYFLKEMVKTCLFFLMCAYGLYALVDYASHSASFHHHHAQFLWSQVALYYLCDFANRAEVLLPFCLLIATIRILCNLNAHNELVALMSSGISLHTLMRPFLFVGFSCVLLMYINVEFIESKALRMLNQIHDSQSSKKAKKTPDLIAHHLVLDDASTLIYQHYDPAPNRFYDAYWIRNIDELYRIRNLNLNPEHPEHSPTGYFVDHLTRDSQGQLVLNESLQERRFPEMHFNKETLLNTMTPPDEQPISELWEKLPQSEAVSEKEAEILAAFHLKLILPWLCLLAVLGPAPFCLRITRNLPTFFIYAGSLFGLIAMYILFDAATVVSERQLLSPFVAMWIPFAAISGLIGWKYAIIH